MSTDQEGHSSKDEQVHAHMNSKIKNLHIDNIVCAAVGSARDGMKTLDN